MYFGPAKLQNKLQNSQTVFLLVAEKETAHPGGM